MAVIDGDRAKLPTDLPPIMKTGVSGPIIIASKKQPTMPGRAEVGNLPSRRKKKSRSDHGSDVTRAAVGGAGCVRAQTSKLGRKMAQIAVAVDDGGE